MDRECITHHNACNCREERFARMRTLLWDFVAAPQAASNEEQQAIVVSHDLWNEAAELVGYDEMGQ